MAKTRKCRLCGFTQLTPFFDGCSWVAEDLCFPCADVAWFLSGKGNVLALLRDAKALCKTACSDLQKNDRIDALDQLDMAARGIETARSLMRASMPSAGGA